jgi:hypothetical protein
MNCPNCNTCLYVKAFHDFMDSIWYECSYCDIIFKVRLKTPNKTITTRILYSEMVED